MTKRGIRETFKIIVSILCVNSFFELTNATNNSILFFVLVILIYYSFNTCREKWGKMLKSNKVYLICFSILMTLTTLLGGKVVVEGNNFYSGSYKENYFAKVTIDDLVWSVCFFFFSICVVLVLLALYDRITFLYYKKMDIFINEKKMFILCWIVIFLCWIPYLIVYYPGAIYGDSQVSIAQALEYAPLTNHHPVMYTLIIKFFLSIGIFFENISVGCCLYTVFQMLLVSGIFSYFLIWLRRKQIHDLVICFVCAFYAVTPIFPLHAISMWKDPIFASFLLLLSLITYDIIISEGKLLEKNSTNFKLLVISLIICFIRNNGIYILIVYWITLTGYYYFTKKRRLKKRKFVTGFIAGFAIYAVVTGPVYSRFSITSEFVESLSIPLQQMSSVVVYGGEMTETQEEFLYNMLPEEDFKASYTPCCVDNIKWHPNFNDAFLEDNKLEFFQTWAGMLVPNLKLYIKAYVCETFEYWSFSDIKRNTYVDGINTLQYTDNIPAKDYSEIWFGTSWKSKIPFSYVFFSEGIVTWIMLFCILQLWISKKRNIVLAVVPLLTAWATLLISVPHAAWQRYTLSSTFALPFFLMLYVIVTKNDSMYIE